MDGEILYAPPATLEEHRAPRPQDACYFWWVFVRAAASRTPAVCTVEPALTGILVDALDVGTCELVVEIGSSNLDGYRYPVVLEVGPQ